MLGILIKNNIQIFLVIAFLMFAKSTFAQSSTTYVSLHETNYKIGDLMKSPQIAFSLSGGFFPDNVYLDSVKVIADFLHQHPNLKVEIGSHTDSRGTADKNIILSQKRAEGIETTLIGEFYCNPNQIVAKGYGEQVPLVSDAEILAAETKEKKEEMHQKNRRVELKVVEVLK